MKREKVAMAINDASCMHKHVTRSIQECKEEGGDMNRLK